MEERKVAGAILIVFALLLLLPRWGLLTFSTIRDLFILLLFLVGLYLLFSDVQKDEVKAS
ncbi:MAG: hypothetical protein GXO00_01055 [Candidatus Diapherotrites archaeon]|nr:hypothetical protein [Candidatus Diapherotrites archaeon]